MKHAKVGSVMTSDVVSARPGTPFKEVARLLAEHRISGLPVVDDDDKVLGVLSETDLMAHQAEAEDPYEPPRRLHAPALGHAARSRRAKARARTAGELMSSPAVTVRADDTIAGAARVMAQHRVERLPVLDTEDRLVGIVTRRSLLQVFLRADEEIRAEVIRDVLVGTLWLEHGAVDITVEDGVVTLTGQLERRSEVPVAVRVTGMVDGVVDVVDKLGYRTDDSHLHPDEPAMRGIADDWMRKL
ncbi:CBS domain-containing protein [Streptomyces sp. TLI_146]|uniref:CBS domain-containing protein n=1 Tax=Streptomyces sp. TLI_146 TaxID=1938858 RepID=UPI000C704370|nr:CBS domain-containing protein [Streptomyces sp. TLI_146]PKV83158.1 BON domain-containing protein [Streptomyces sp. TLI_146]